MSNIGNNPDSGEKTHQGDDIRTIDNLESSNERWKHLRLKKRYLSLFFD